MSSSSPPSTQGRPRRKSSSNPMFAEPDFAVNNKKRQTSFLISASQMIARPLGLLSAFIYGICIFTIFAIRAFIEGCILHSPDKNWWDKLAAARTRQYALDKAHPSGLNHAFFTLPNHLRLHYLTNAEQIIETKSGEVEVFHKKSKNLVIFLHGWPDTGAMWSFVIGELPDSAKTDTTIVAVDLPGFGGSDSLISYGPNQVMTAMTEFCMGMRDEYLDESLGGKVINVSFDWGAVIGFKLAATAHELADRFIFCNSSLPQAARHNVQEKVAAFNKLLGVWYRTDRKNFKRFMKSFGPLYPVLGQLLKSGYIFTFNLPWPLAQQTVLRCNLWLLRFINSMGFGYRGITDAPEVLEELAAYLGPLPMTSTGSYSTPHAYGATVNKRALTKQGATEPLFYYRNGLASKPWDKPVDLAVKLAELDKLNRSTRKKTASSGTNCSLPGALGAPTTIIWGDMDPALDFRIMLEGIEDYLKNDSQVIRLPKIGHWVPKQGEGPAVISAVVAWALGPESSDTLADALKVSATARISVSK